MSDSVWPHRQQPTSLPRPWDSPGKNTGVGCQFLLRCMKVKMKGKSLSHVRLLATPWFAAYQAPPSMGFSRQEYCSGVPLPSPWLNYLCAVSQRTTMNSRRSYQGTFPVIQWWRLCTYTAGGMSLIPGCGTKIPQATGCGQKKKLPPNKKPLLTNII